MRELTYYVACSIDGFIARANGSFDYFLTEGDHLQDIVQSFPETLSTHWRAMLAVDTENRVFDTVLMGRATYEVGVREGMTSPYKHLRQYLFSRTMKASPDPEVELVRDQPLAAVRRLKQDTGKAIWLCGGAKLATELFPEIDELILKVNPVVIGSGIPLFSNEVPATRFDLASVKTYASGVVILRYRRQPQL
jgi:dihydrofolate reductase